MQDVRGYSALHAGLLTIPMAVMLAVLSVVSGRLVASRGPRFSLVASGAIIASSSAGIAAASHAAWAVVAGCGVMVMAGGIVSTGPWALAIAERNGGRLAAGPGPAPEGAR